MAALREEDEAFRTPPGMAHLQVPLQVLGSHQADVSELLRLLVGDGHHYAVLVEFQADQVSRPISPILAMLS